MVKCDPVAARLPPFVPILHKFLRPLHVDYTLDIWRQKKVDKAEKTVQVVS